MVSVGNGVNWNLLVVVVVGRGPLVGTVGTSGVVLGGIGVVEIGKCEISSLLSGLNPGGRSLETSSIMTGMAGETRKPSIKTPAPGDADETVGGEKVISSSSSSAILAALDTVLTRIEDCSSCVEMKTGLSVSSSSRRSGISVVKGLILLLGGALVTEPVGRDDFLLPVIDVGRRFSFLLLGINPPDLGSTSSRLLSLSSSSSFSLCSFNFCLLLFPEGTILVPLGLILEPVDEVAVCVAPENLDLTLLLVGGSVPSSSTSS